jgi:hypothetical protein
MLRHAIHAGAYAYGNFPTDPRRKALGKSKTGRWVADADCDAERVQLAHRSSGTTDSSIVNRTVSVS